MEFWPVIGYDPATMQINLPQRPRRNRRMASIRDMVRETRLHPADLIQPVFVQEEGEAPAPIGAMPGVCRYPLAAVAAHCREAWDLGIRAVALFPALPQSQKDSQATESANDDGLLQRCVRHLKRELPELCVITDVAMDPYSSDGHDGILRKDGEIDNDATLPVLCAMAVAQAKAGADIVAPSDMMDGRVGEIRKALDAAGFTRTGILAYAAKYASAFYGPFREALDSAPRQGDKRSYQMDPANRREALREVALDVSEGADMVMVKPALAYLDIIAAIKASVSVPVVAYNVSGEHAMVQAVGQKGWLDAERVQLEILTAIKRAGADIILTYSAIDAARSMQ